MRPLLIRSLFFLLAFSSLTACRSTQTAPAGDAQGDVPDAYTAVPSGKSIFNYVDQRVQVDAVVAKEISQHMMRGGRGPGGDPLEDVYLDLPNGAQIVGYYTKGLTIPDDGKAHTYYGRVGSISGPGKGGGEHTEVYLDIDRVD